MFMQFYLFQEFSFPDSLEILNALNYVKNIPDSKSLEKIIIENVTTNMQLFQN